MSEILKNSTGITRGKKCRNTKAHLRKELQFNKEWLTFKAFKHILMGKNSLCIMLLYAKVVKKTFNILNPLCWYISNLMDFTCPLRAYDIETSLKGLKVPPG